MDIKENRKPDYTGGLKTVSRYCQWLKDELDFRRSKNLDVSELKRYYRNILNEKEQVIPMGVYGYYARLQPMIREISAAGEGVRILDAGSGYGSESILFAILSGNVHGVELVSERMKLARSRLEFYQNATGHSMKISFIHSNIFKYLQECAPFDIIFVMEAISHIFPPEEFLKLARTKLKSGGKIIITDPNKLNPLAWARSIRIRGSVKHSPHQRFQDPDTGEPVDYGQEKIHTPSQLKRLLTNSGFVVDGIHYSGFMGSSILPDRLIMKDSIYRLFSTAQQIFCRIPLLRSLGSIFTIVGHKPDQGRKK